MLSNQSIKQRYLHSKIVTRIIPVSHNHSFAELNVTEPCGLQDKGDLSSLLVYHFQIHKETDTSPSAATGEIKSNYRYKCLLM